MGANRPDTGEITAEQLGELGDVELAKEYARTKGSREVGEEVMRRVVEYAGHDPDEYLDRSLKSDNGEVLTDDDSNPIPVGRYLPDGVAQHKPQFRKAATKGVLDFLVRGHEEPAEQRAMADMLDKRSLEKESS